MVDDRRFTDRYQEIAARRQLELEQTRREQEMARRMQEIRERETRWANLSGDSYITVKPRDTSCSYKKCEIADTFINRGAAKFGQDGDWCSKIEHGTIPYSNCSQSIKDSWFVSSSILVPTKNAKSFTPLDSKIWPRWGLVQQDSTCYHSILQL